MEIWGPWLPLLVGRDIRRHKVNTAEFTTLFRRPRQGYMPVVDRIKASAKQANIHVCDPDSESLTQA